MNWGAIVALVAIPIVSFIPQTWATYVHGRAILIVSWMVVHRMVAERSVGPTRI